MDRSTLSDSAILRSLGASVRAHRERHGWSQEELAETCRLHRTYIGAIERGERNLGVVNLFRIAKALGVPPIDLLT